MAKSLSFFPIVDLKGYDVDKRMIRYIQINHVIKKLNTMITETEENIKKTKFNFMIDLKTVIHKTSVDPSLLQLKKCVRNKWKDWAPGEFSPVHSKIPESFGLLVSGDRIVIPEEVKRPVIGALHLGHPGSTKMLTQNTFLWLSGWKKDIKKCSKWTAYMSSDEFFEYQLPSTKKKQITGFDRTPKR